MNSKLNSIVITSFLAFAIIAGIPTTTINNNIRSSTYKEGSKNINNINNDNQEKGLLD
jgi:hypothetical protein